MKKKFKVGDIVMIIGNEGLITHFHQIGNLAVVEQIGSRLCNIGCVSYYEHPSLSLLYQWHYPENLVKIGVL